MDSVLANFSRCVQAFRSFLKDTAHRAQGTATTVAVSSLGSDRLTLSPSTQVLLGPLQGISIVAPALPQAVPAVDEADEGEDEEDNDADDDEAAEASDTSQGAMTGVQPEVGTDAAPVPALPRLPQPTPTPAVPAPARVPAPTPAPAQGFDFPGLAAGKQYKLDGHYDGHSFGGKGRINSFDGKTLDLTLAVSAAMGFYQTSAHIQVAQRGDGKYTVNVVRDGKEAGAIHAEATAIAQQQGLLTVQTTDGKQVTIRSTGGGNLAVSYLGNEVQLQAA